MYDGGGSGAHFRDKKVLVLVPDTCGLHDLEEDFKLAPEAVLSVSPPPECEWVGAELHFEWSKMTGIAENIFV